MLWPLHGSESRSLSQWKMDNPARTRLRLLQTISASESIPYLAAAVSFFSHSYDRKTTIRKFIAKSRTLSSFCGSILKHYWNRGFSQKALDAVALPWFTILNMCYNTLTTPTYLQRRVCALHSLPRTVNAGMTISNCGSGDVATSEDTTMLVVKALNIVDHGRSKATNSIF